MSCARPLRRRVAFLAAALLLGVGGQAGGFDTGPHADITRDALASEGFGTTSIQVAQVHNWFVDLYSNAADIPHSGHAGGLVTLIGSGVDPLPWGFDDDREFWPQAVVEAAEHTHFDLYNRDLRDTGTLAEEWRRLQRATWTLAREARDRGDPRMLLAVLGISLHQVQDFYSHSSWVEPAPLGPGWATRGLGATPTWFDVTAADVAASSLSFSGGHGARRHGSWRADENTSLTSAMAKDWPGRPLYAEAHQAAYFATRQWVQAVRAWVGDDMFWNRAMTVADRAGGGLDHDVRGMTAISLFTGHWQGQGEPCNPQFVRLTCGPRVGLGGSLTSARQATKRYFEDRPRTIDRRMFESVVVRLAAPGATGALGPVPSSVAMQQSTRFVRMRVRSYAKLAGGTVPGPDLDAEDFSVQATIAGQPFQSAVINGRERFTFPRPYHPFTFLKAVPSGRRFPEAVRSITVRIRTGDVRGAGTDSEVRLRISERWAFTLDRRAFDDFERGDDRVYSVPVDDAVTAGLTVDDIRYLRIDKGRDGLTGAWRLDHVWVEVNGRPLFAGPAQRWLRDGRLTWRAPWQPAATQAGTKVPVTVALVDDDGLVFGADDPADLHPDDRRRVAVLTHAPEDGVRVAAVAGGSRHKGRVGDDDRSRALVALDTLDVVLPPSPSPSPAEPPPAAPTDPGTGPPAPPPGPVQLPDLVATDLRNNRTTVTNAGSAAAGPSVISVNLTLFSVPGLAPAESATVTYPCIEGPIRVLVDRTGLIQESNEANNLREGNGIC